MSEQPYSISSSHRPSDKGTQGNIAASAQRAAEGANRLEQESNLMLEIQALQILDSSDDCIKVLDLDGRILFMSRGGQALLGIQDVTPFLNTSWAGFWQGADQQAASEAIAQARAGQVCTFQGYCPTLSGEPKWWDSKVSPMRGVDGQVEQLLCISRDITERRQIEDERKQAEQKSREADERYRAIINQAVAGVVCTDLDGNLTLVNQKYCDITGYSADELMQLRMQDITHPEDLPRNVELFHRLRTEGTPFEIEKRYIRKDGSIVWVNNSVSVIHDREGKPQSAAAIVLDITKRKQAETALRESEARYRSLFNSIEEGYFLADVIFDNHDQPIDICYLEANPAATRMVGQDFTGRRLREIEPNYEAYWYEICGRVARTGKGERLQRYAAPDQKWYDFYVVKVGDEDSTHLAVVFHDITHHKRREANLAFLAEIMAEFAPLKTADEIMRITCAKTVAYFNLSRCSLVKINETTNAAQVVYDFSTDDLPSLVDTYQIADFHTVDELQELADGRAIVVHDVAATPRRPKAVARFTQLQVGALVNAPYVSDGQWKFVLSAMQAKPRLWCSDEIEVLQELSARVWLRIERAQAEAALRESEARLQRAIAIETVGIIFFRAEGGITDCNDAFLRMTGYSRKDFEQGRMRWDALTPPEWMAPSQKAIEEFLTLGRITPYEKEYIRKDGSRWWGLFAASRLNETEGVEFIIDVSARKRAEAEREQLLTNEQQARAAAEASREEAEAANRVKDEFLAVLSHELRSPLNPILGWAKLLLDNKLDETKTRQALMTIQRNAKLQSELIEDLLDVSRILRGKLSIYSSPVKLATTVCAAIETIRLAAEAKSVMVEANFDADIGSVLGDATRLQQVMWNLLSNAVKFTPIGGRVEVQLEQIERQAQITIHDTGKGIAADFLPYVFDYFRQADSTTTRKFGGLGLGLAIVRHLVELHGGTVQATSQGEGLGATFIVQLPLMPIQPTHDSQLDLPLSTPDLTDIQVLVVDDDADSRDFIAFVLEQSGAQVSTATSAIAALSRLTQFQPDVLISDIGMPDMDGYMLMQQVRALPAEQYGNIAAIALTAYAGDFNQQRAVNAGFQQHIAKPVEPEQLIKVIVNLLGSRRCSTN